MPDGTVKSELREGIATLTLARPARLNALTFELLLQLRSALRDLAANPGCRVVVLTGEGTSFCAGMDLEHGTRRHDAPDPVQAEHDGLRLGIEVVLSMREMPQPVIAAIKGHAVGAGFALAAACDIRIASAEAQFIAPFLRLGVTGGDLGLSWFLPRLIGAGRTAHLMYSAGALAAGEAEQLGLVATLADDPVASALSYAEQIAAFPPYGVAATKQLMDASQVAGLREHLDSEARAQVIGLLTTDSRTAVSQALEKKSSSPIR